jgi:L-Ala-D/L-Glu epimerase
MEIRLFKLKLALRNPFRLAHGSYSYRENLFIHLREGDAVGMGEAPVVPYYGLTADEVEADLRRGLSRRSVDEALAGPGMPSGSFAYPVSRSAFQAAVLSLRASVSGGALGATLGLEGGASPRTSFTVAYDDDTEAMVALAAASGFRRLKIKAGIPGDIERIGAIRHRLPEAIIRVDANQGWSVSEAGEKLVELDRLGVELVEEPCACEPAELEKLASSTPVPIILDESARDVDQVKRYAREAPSVAGIVVKLAKNGGPAASLDLARAALESGMKIMVSSMVETSLGVAAALALAPLCAWCDLDAPLLLADDPFTGLVYEGETPRLEGSGVIPGPGLAKLIEGLEPVDREV